MKSEDQATERQPQPPEEDAIELRIEYSPTRQALLWIVEYAGSLSCWSERSLQEAIGGLVLVHMESENLNTYSITEYGMNFNGHNYKTQDDLGETVLLYLSGQGYRFGARTLDDPSLILCGLRDEDQAPATEPNKLLQSQSCQTQPTTPIAQTTTLKTLWCCLLTTIRHSKR